MNSSGMCAAAAISVMGRRVAARAISRSEGMGVAIARSNTMAGFRRVTSLCSNDTINERGAGMVESVRRRHWRVDNETRSGRHARQGMELRNAYKATALSTVLPGAGLFRVNRRLASVIVLLFLIPLGYLAWLFVREGALSSVLVIGVCRRKILVVVGVIGSLALAWIVGIIATARGTRPRSISRTDGRLLTAFTAAMCLVVMAPTALAINGVSIQRET